jgi:hypothetical protein
LSLRTWTPKRTSEPLLRPMAQRSSQSTPQHRPASSWQAAPGGTLTQRSQAARASLCGCGAQLCGPGPRALRGARRHGKHSVNRFLPGGHPLWFFELRRSVTGLPNVYAPRHGGPVRASACGKPGRAAGAGTATAQAGARGRRGARAEDPGCRPRQGAPGLTTGRCGPGAGRGKGGEP